MDLSDHRSTRKTPEARLAEIIPGESAFFPLYAGNPTLDEVLHIEPEALREPPSFQQGLQAQRIMTGLSAQALGKRVISSGGDIGFVSRIIAGGVNYDRDTRHPIMNSDRFLGLSHTVRDDENPDTYDRISVLFYDAGTGDLALKTWKKYGSVLFTATRSFLTVADKQTPNEEQRAEYIRGVLTQAAKQKKLGVDTEFTGSCRTRRFMEIAEESLGLVPIYLVRTVLDKQFKTNGNILRKHLGLPEKEPPQPQHVSAPENPAQSYSLA